MSGKLYIVSTPIGNLKDITLRALETLKSVSVILAEDTRTTQILLNEYQIQGKRVISYHSKNEKQRLPQVMEHLALGTDMALVSEAGTPLISDPGFLLVQEAVALGVTIVPIPGVSALTTLLPVSAFPLSSFYFAGFLSPKSGKRVNQLKALKGLETVLVFYESPYRVEKTLTAMLEVFGPEAQVVIGRELTKKFEEILRGKLESIVNNSKFVVKGEFCILLKNY